MHFPTDLSMFTWYIIIAILLFSLFFGVGYAYSKILKKHRNKEPKNNFRPTEIQETSGN